MTGLITGVVAVVLAGVQARFSWRLHDKVRAMQTKMAVEERRRAEILRQLHGVPAPRHLHAVKGNE